jgi:diguanylate cyclase (GGDEF)-like protein
VAYIDVDNFKFVNDFFGHAIGDEVLSNVVKLTRDHIRSTDQIARFGGDEFVLIFPEMDQASARLAVPKIHEYLNTEMQKRNIPVTFSIGVLTCTAAPPTTDALVAMADRLMYSVKNSGKNSVRYDTYSGAATKQQSGVVVEQSGLDPR